jgi:uncharacterized protein (DUF608 family)
VLKEYDGKHLGKIAMPLGGIGTGTISLGGKGDLRDWELCNAPGKGFVPFSDPDETRRVSPFFCVRCGDQAGQVATRMLEGPIELTDYEGQFGSQVPNHGFPRFREAEFHAAYPFGQVLLSDPDMPVRARLKAFNPLVPADTEASGLPVAVLSYEFENLTDGELDLSVCGTIPNYIGDDNGSSPIPHMKDGFSGARGNRNEVRNANGLKGIFMHAPELPEDCRHQGNISLTTLSDGTITYRTSWKESGWGGTKLDFWNDFTEDGKAEERESESDRPLASLCVQKSLPAGERTEITFLITWHFPNRKGWSPNFYSPEMQTCQDHPTVGNYYTTLYSDSFDAAVQIAPRLAALEQQSLLFVNSFIHSDLPEVVKEAALFNLSTLRTETCLRTADGRFYAWEGSCDCMGCCEGSCTHVWNYEHATALLFGSLARDMRKTEFLHGTGENGHMSFRIGIPLESEARAFKIAAADGQMGCIMKMYREWQLSGDDELLKRLWPQVRKALEFCWIEGGWDADQDGVMEGCQHNTMDVEYYGPNPQMGFWYLGALRCAALMADHLGETAFASKCRKLEKGGALRLEDQCFNGEFFEHVIEPMAKDAMVADGLTHEMGAKDRTNPDLQLGAGCLVDQLVGQCTAHVLGIGSLSDRAKQRKTLESIYTYNFKRDFNDHFNHFRSFVLGNESATLMATYPKGRAPLNPFPYANEVMTGFEYTAAIHMLYEGMTEQGLELIGAIRDRYDGLKRSPFDEAECGHHYGRALASWSAVLALTGFHYSGVEKSICFTARPGTHFWSNGDAWGTCNVGGNKAVLTVLYGTLELELFRMDNGIAYTEPFALETGESKELRLTPITEK